MTQFNNDHKIIERCKNRYKLLFDMIDKPKILIWTKEALIKNANRAPIQARSYTLFLLSYLLWNNPESTDQIKFIPLSFHLDGICYILLTLDEMILNKIVESVEVKGGMLVGPNCDSDSKLNTIVGDDIQYIGGYNCFFLDRDNLGLESIADILQYPGTLLELKIHMNLLRGREFIETYLSNFHDNQTLDGDPTVSFDEHVSIFKSIFKEKVLVYGNKPFWITQKELQNAKVIDFFAILKYLENKGYIQIYLDSTGIQYHNTTPNSFKIEISLKGVEYFSSSEFEVTFFEENKILIYKGEDVRLTQEEIRLISEYIDLLSVKNFVSIEELAGVLDSNYEVYTQEIQKKLEKSIRDRIRNINRKLRAFSGCNEYFYIKTSNIFMKNITVK